MNNEKIVHFFEWCKTCIHYKEKETEDPCDDCLTFATNTDSHKPVRYEENTTTVKMKNRKKDK